MKNHGLLVATVAGAWLFGCSGSQRPSSSTAGAPPSTADAGSTADTGSPTVDVPPDGPHGPETVGRRRADAGAVERPPQGPWGPRLAIVPAFDLLVPFGDLPYVSRLRAGFSFDPFSNFGMALGPVFQWPLSPNGAPNPTYAGAEVRLLYHFNEDPMATFRPALVGHATLVGNVSARESGGVTRPSALVEAGLGLEAHLAPATTHVDVRPSITVARVSDVEGVVPGAWYAVFGLGVAIGDGAIPGTREVEEPGASGGLRRHLLADLLQDLPPGAARDARPCRVEIPNAYAAIAVGPLSASGCDAEHAGEIAAEIAAGTCAVWLTQSTRGRDGVQDINLRVVSPGSDGPPLGEDNSTDDWPTVFVCNPTDAALPIQLQGSARNADQDGTVAAAIDRFDFPLPWTSAVSECGDEGELDGSACIYRMRPGNVHVAHAPPGGRVCVRAPAYSQATISVARIETPAVSLATRSALSLSREHEQQQCITLDRSGTGYVVSTRVPEGGALTVPVVVRHDSTESPDDSLLRQLHGARPPLDGYQAHRLVAGVSVRVRSAPPLPPFTTLIVRGQVLGHERSVPISLALGETPGTTTSWVGSRSTASHLPNDGSDVIAGRLYVSLGIGVATARVAVSVEPEPRRPRWNVRGATPTPWPALQGNNLGPCPRTLVAGRSCTQAPGTPLTVPAGRRVCFATRDGLGVTHDPEATPAAAYSLAGEGNPADCHSIATTFHFSSPTLVYAP